LASGVDISVTDNTNTGVMSCILEYPYWRKLSDCPNKAQMAVGINEFLLKNGRDRECILKMVKNKGGVIEMFEKSKIIDIISFKTQLINDTKLLKDRVEEIKRIVDLFSHFCAWKDFEILAAYESTDIRIKQDYDDIMRMLRIKLRFWINLNIDKRFTFAQNFKKIWIPCFSEFL